MELHSRKRTMGLHVKPETATEPYYVSIIIPVFNDAMRLTSCLEALVNQTYPKKLFEIIIVDNSSDEDIEGICRLFERVIYTHEPRHGSYAARNKGISLAKGEVIAFTDSDCIPEPDWLECGVRRLSSGQNVGFVAGHIKVFPEDVEKPTAVELYEIATAFKQRYYVARLKFGVTANLFTTRSVIEAVGNFNDDMKSAGDMNWGRRVWAHDYLIQYARDVCVSHPARSTFDQLSKRIRRQVGGEHNLASTSLASHSFALVRYLLLRPAKSLALLIASRELTPQQKVGAATVVFTVSYIQLSEKIKLLAGQRAQR